MQAGILGITDDLIDEPAVTTGKKGGGVTIASEAITYLSGETEIYEGTAAGHVDTTKQFVETAVSSDGDIIDIFTSSEPARREVAVDFTADLTADPGFVAVSSTDGEFLWEHLSAAKDTWIERAVIDLNSFAGALEDEDADVWQVGEEQASENGYVSIDYHDAAHPPSGGSHVVQLGFVYPWNSTVVRGTITESGYVAVYAGATQAATWGRWLREEVLPHVALPEGPTCDRCGNEPERGLKDGLCIVCRDRADEDGSEA
ncbi:hypothetical protein G9C85_02500 [Halorubellus sp. JP-L1]|uniref:hypothetical protein n=1 Tax=Halorubellus sp. JP-L1 TaxID=2715753 RepID=UPI00140E8240|nr:hypothetical protein [Halorubellus sp. JP-L1]NHN40508.1 hypothetical protein [Halorubellus sp. JP-L1]